MLWKMVCAHLSLGKTAVRSEDHLRFNLAKTLSPSHAETRRTKTMHCNVLVLTRVWADAWSTAATDSEVLDSMSSKTISMFS